MLYRVHFAWMEFELTTVVVICTDYIGSHQSNYHTITTTMTSWWLYASYLSKWSLKKTYYWHSLYCLLPWCRLRNSNCLLIKEHLDSSAFYFLFVCLVFFFLSYLVGLRVFHIFFALCPMLAVSLHSQLFGYLQRLFARWNYQETDCVAINDIYSKEFN